MQSRSRSGKRSGPVGRIIRGLLGVPPARMRRSKRSRQGCECIEWNACHFAALDRKRIRCAPCPEIINAIPPTPADRFPLSASRRDSIVRLRPRRWWWWWWCWWRRRRRWRCGYGRRKRRGRRHRRGYDRNSRKHHTQRHSPAGPVGQGMPGGGAPAGSNSGAASSGSTAAGPVGTGVRAPRIINDPSVGSGPSAEPGGASR